MNKLILHPTDMSQWHALVNEGQVATQIILNEYTESYLVFLLMRYIQKPELIKSIIAMDFLDSIHCTRTLQIKLLRDIGDKSLLFCGLFPGLARKRCVNLDYFIGMGQSAYLSVGELEDKKSGIIYFQLSEQFENLQKILQAMQGHCLMNHGKLSMAVN